MSLAAVREQVAPEQINYSERHREAGPRYRTVDEGSGGSQRVAVGRRPFLGVGWAEAVAPTTLLGLAVRALALVTLLRAICESPKWDAIGRISGACRIMYIGFGAILLLISFSAPQHWTWLLRLLMESIPPFPSRTRTLHNSNEFLSHSLCKTILPNTRIFPP